MKGIRRLIQEINRYRNPESSNQDSANQWEDNRKLVEAIDLAHKEWQEARCTFNQIDDPELIDHAIYAVEAAEKKYVYLLKKAKAMGYKAYMEEEEGRVALKWTLS